MEHVSNEQKARRLCCSGCNNYVCYTNKKQCLTLKDLLTMADWKDEQHKQEKQLLIDKAAEWIDNNVNHYIFENEYGETYIKYTFTEDFIKAMKGE